MNQRRLRAYSRLYQRRAVESVVTFGRRAERLGRDPLTGGQINVMHTLPPVPGN